MDGPVPASDGHFARALLEAVRELHRCLPACASRDAVRWAVIDVLFADAHQRVGAEVAARLREWAAQVTEPVEGDGEQAEKQAGLALASLVNVVRRHCGPSCAPAFCEAQAVFCEGLEARVGSGLPGAEAALDAPEADEPPLADELEAVRSAFDVSGSCDSQAAEGSLDVCVWEDRQNGLDRVLRVTLGWKDGSLMRVEASGMKTTADELVLNAIYAAWRRHGSISAWDAVEIARKTFSAADAETAAAAPSAGVAGRGAHGVRLDSDVQGWFEWRFERSSMELAWFSYAEVARRAQACVNKHLASHKRFEQVGSPEVVLSEALAARFSARLEEIRLCTDSWQTRSPGLVFHASPSRDALQSILRRGFLLPGDWIEGTPQFLGTEHGAGSGVGVYCSPELETADRYCGDLQDSEQVGLAIVALAAFGACWEPRSGADDAMRRSRCQWFRPPALAQDGALVGGWRRRGNFWVADQEATVNKGKPAAPLLAHAPDACGLYDGQFHSRRPQGGSRGTDEVVLAAPEQLLPVLLVKYRPRKREAQRAETTRMPGSNVHHFVDTRLPTSRDVLCAPVSEDVDGVDLKSLPLKEDTYWALFVDWERQTGSGYGVAGAADSRAPSVHVCFVLDAAVRGTAFGAQLGALVQGVTSAVGPADACAVWFDVAAGLRGDACVPFLPPETFHATFAEKAAKLTAAPPACDGASGVGLADALRVASHGALRKLERMTEQYLERMAVVWHRVECGDELLATSGHRAGHAAAVVAIRRSVFEVTALAVAWSGAAGPDARAEAAAIRDQGESEITVEWSDGGVTVFAATAVRKRCPRPRDVAAETQFAFVLVSELGPDLRTDAALTELAEVTSCCGAQLRGSGAPCCWTPVVLGGDDAAQRLGAHLKFALSTGTGARAAGGAAWWEPVHHCAEAGELQRCIEVLQEDLVTWASDHVKAGAEVGLDMRYVRHDHGFVVNPLEDPRWQAQVRRPRPELEGASAMRGTCLLFRGPPPKTVRIDGEDCAVQLAPSLCPAARPSAALEFGFALDRLAQKLQVSSLFGGGLRGLPTPEARERMEMWAGRLRSWAQRLEKTAAVDSQDQGQGRGGRALKVWSMSAEQRAAYMHQKRSLTSSLLRTVNSVEEAVQVRGLLDREPTASAWLKRLSDMRFKRAMLRRIAKASVPEAEVLEQFWSSLGTAPTPESTEPWLRSRCSALSAVEHLEQARQLQRLSMQDVQTALYMVGMVGVQIRCVRTEASNIDPWVLIVDYVSRSMADTVSAACAVDAGERLEDEDGEDAPDVVVLWPRSSREPFRWFAKTALYGAYLAMVFTRNPVCTVPTQRVALPVLVWVKSAEQLLLRCRPQGSDAEEPPAAELEATAALWRVHAMAADAAGAFVSTWEALAGRLVAGDAAAALTEAGDGPTSVCAALAALCFARAAAPLWASAASLGDGALRALSLALLAEAVSRGCRKLCRSRGGEAGDVAGALLREALGVTEDSVLRPGDGEEPPERRARGVHNDAFDLQRALRKSALFFAPGGRYFQMGLTNCTPQGVVGSLLLHLFALRSGDAPSELHRGRALALRLWRRDLSMRAFIEAVLPDTDPRLVQAALYAQGLRYQTARDRLGGVTPLSEPERILRELAQEQRHLAYMRALQAKLQAASSGRRAEARSARRSARLLDFAAAHKGLPKLFTLLEVDELNSSRPEDDRLELLPMGLLKSHCCFPSCPLYLQDLRTATDRRMELAAKDGQGAGIGRRGLFKHLAPMMWPEAGAEDRYVPLLHSVGAMHAAAQVEDFARTVTKGLEKQLSVARALGPGTKAWLQDSVRVLHQDFQRLHK